jgi:hypothetical protein
MLAWTPTIAGLNVTWKVVLPPGTTLESGKAVKAKPDPDKDPPGSLRSADPVLSMVKVRTTLPVLISALPKSVLSDGEGVLSPLIISTLFPSTLISGAAVPVPWMSKL